MLSQGGLEARAHCWPQTSPHSSLKQLALTDYNQHTKILALTSNLGDHYHLSLAALFLRDSQGSRTDRCVLAQESWVLGPALSLCHVSPRWAHARQCLALGLRTLCTNKCCGLAADFPPPPAQGACPSFCVYLVVTSLTIL